MENDIFTKDDGFALANRMDNYASSVDRGGVVVFNAINGTQWNDAQSAKFQNACGHIIGDLINAVNMVDAYKDRLVIKLNSL